MPAQHFATHFREHQKVIDACIASLQPASDAAADAIISCLGRGGKILAFGNGGSATQASHLVEELIGRFKETRQPLPAISLVGDSGVVTCIANDFGYGALFERQVEALRGDGRCSCRNHDERAAPRTSCAGSRPRKRKARLRSRYAGNRARGGEADHVIAVRAMKERTSRKFT